VKGLQIDMGMLPITTNTSDELFSRININDFERFWTSKIRGLYWFLRSSAAAHTPRMNCDKMAGDKLTVCKHKMLWAFARLASISSIFFCFFFFKLLNHKPKAYYRLDCAKFQNICILHFVNINEFVLYAARICSSALLYAVRQEIRNVRSSPSRTIKMRYIAPVF